MKKYFSKEIINYKNSKKISSIISSKILESNFYSPRLNYFNYSKKRNSFQFNTKHSKEITSINKSIVASMKSVELNPLKNNLLKINSLRKNYKKKFKTGIVANTKISLKSMEINLRKKLIDMNNQIEKEESPKKLNDISVNNKSICIFESDFEGQFLKFNNASNTKSIGNTINKLSSKNIIKKNSYNIMRSEKKKNNQKNIELKISSKSLHILNGDYSKAIINEHNFRKLIKTKILYDSFEDNESENENETEGFLSPNNNFIFIFDLLIIISTLIVDIYNPYYISTMKCFCFPIPFIIKYIYFFIDILFIFDLLLGFWRPYYNPKWQLVTKIPYIVKHYFSTQFIMDFLQSFPILTLLIFRCNRNEHKKYCMSYNMTNDQVLLIIFTVFKQLKFYKMTNKKTNSVIFWLYELTNKENSIQDFLDISIITLSSLFGFYTFISLHIFIASQNYPNWITSSNLQDHSILLIYLNSFYFIITTITTVGYGDLLGSSLSETIFRIILLTIGISLYSWIVSNIGNYVNNESRISIKFNKDEGILEEIRISYPNMPYKLYNKILHHLELRKLRQKKLDLNLLINSLPYSLRNTILFSIHHQIIKNFKIFKKCQNSDFINQLLTNFIPLFSKKNAILIYENQLIENLIFVKEGRLSLDAGIEIEDPEKSINQYFHYKFHFINEKNTESKIESIHLTSKSVIPSDFDNINNNNIKKNSNSKMDESSIEKEIGKLEFEGEEFEESDYQFINILSIVKNESYGLVNMFLTKPSPLFLRVKSKKAELFLLRKLEAFEISKKFPNIWKKQYKRSYINMISIKKRTFRKLSNYCRAYGISFDKNEEKGEIRNNFTIKEILEKAKNKETIRTMRSISNIFKESKNKSSNLTNISNTNNQLQIPANIKSFNESQNTGFFGVSSSQDKNDLMSFQGDMSVKSNKSSLLKNKTKKRSVVSKQRNSTRNSKFQFNSNPNKLSINSFNNDLHSLTIEKEINNENNNTGLPPKNYQNYVNKLKKKIKKLKISKLYYKSLLKKISDKLKEFKKQNNKNVTNEIMMTLVNYKYKIEKNNNTENEKDGIINKSSDNDSNNKNTKVINNVIVQNNNNYICSFSDFISSDSNKSSSSTDRKNDFLIEKISELNYKSEYINLKELTKGEITKNPKFLKKSIDYIIKLYNELKKGINKKEKTQILKNENIEQKLLSKTNINLNSDNDQSKSSLIIDNEKNNKEKNIAKKNNSNVVINNKINSKKKYINNLNYSFKINDDNINLNNNNDINHYDNVDNFNNQKENPTKEKLNNTFNIFYSKNYYIKKNFTEEFDLKKNSRKKDSSINAKISNDKNDKNELKTLENDKESDFINDYNSSLEQNLKSETLSRKRQELISIKKEILQKHIRKKQNKKIKKEENFEKRKECIII